MKNVLTASACKYGEENINMGLMANSDFRYNAT